MKLSERQQTWAILLGYVVLLAVLIAWLLRHDIMTLRRQLVDITCPFLDVAFFLTIAIWTFSIATLRRLFKGVPRFALILVGLLVIGGTLLVATVPPKTHRIYYDETIYQNVGHNLAALGKAQMCNEGGTEYGVYWCSRGEYNKEPNGYPYLLSLSYRIFGVGEGSAFGFNWACFAVGILAVCAIAFLLFGNVYASLFSGLLYLLIPQNLHWFSTTAAEPSAAAAGSLSVLALVVFLRERRTRNLALCGATTAMACYFRTESVFMVAVVGFGLVAICPEEFRNRRLFGVGLLVLTLGSVLCAHLFAVRGESWGSSGSVLGLQYIQENLRTNGLFYLQNQGFPLLFTVLAAIGVLSRQGAPEKMIPVVWLLLLWGVFIPFYAGSYGYGADVRFSVVSYAPLAILGGWGAERLAAFFRSRVLARGPWRAIIAMACVLAFLPFLPQVRAKTQEGWGARADYEYAKEFAELLPPESIVLAHNPNMFQIWGKNAAQMSLATTEKSHVDETLFHRYRDGVYLHWNFWCNVPDPLQNRFAENILKGYAHSLIEERREQDYRYALYKLEAPREENR